MHNIGCIRGKFLFVLMLHFIVNKCTYESHLHLQVSLWLYSKEVCIIQVLDFFSELFIVDISIMCINQIINQTFNKWTNESIQFCLISITIHNMLNKQTLYQKLGKTKK